MSVCICVCACVGAAVQLPSILLLISSFLPPSSLLDSLLDSGEALCGRDKCSEVIRSSHLVLFAAMDAAVEGKEVTSYEWRRDGRE